MYSPLVLLTVLVGCTISAPARSEVDKLRELVNPEFIEFAESLTPEESALMHEIDSKIDYAPLLQPDQYLAAIKLKSQSLYEKTNKFVTFYQELLEKLPKEAQKFVNAVIKYLYEQKDSTAEEGITEIVNNLYDQYDRLSAQDKKELLKHLPIIDYFFGESSMYRALFIAYKMMRMQKPLL